MRRKRSSDDWRHRRPEPDGGLINCPGCGRITPARVHGQMRLYCSVACRKRGIYVGDGSATLAREFLIEWNRAARRAGALGAVP